MKLRSTLGAATFLGSSSIQATSTKKIAGHPHAQALNVGHYQVADDSIAAACISAFADI